jgi:hypothetical protein
MKKFERDPKRMIDMVFVKRLERRLGRNLSEFELEDQDEPIAFCFPNGQIELIQIPRLRFPQDVISKLETTVTLKDENNVKADNPQYRQDIQSTVSNQVSAA